MSNIQTPIDMMTKKILFYIILVIIMNTLNAQGGITVRNANTPVIRLGDQLQNDTFYVGVDGRFVLSFANDSIVQARFFGVDMFDRYQKIPYRRCGDTIFLHNSSQTRLPYSFCTQKPVQGMDGCGGNPVIVKFFYPKLSMARGDVREHRFHYEGIYYMDTISFQLYIPYEEVHCQYSDIIVVSVGNHHARLRKDIDISYYSPYKYFKIDMSNFFPSCEYALFNEFPLVVKGDSIFPVDNEKNYQCWIDNGFFFPVMVKGHGKPKKAKDIPYWRAGLEGVKFEF